jgi:hypothetical protein
MIDSLVSHTGISAATTALHCIVPDAMIHNSLNQADDNQPADLTHSTGNRQQGSTGRLLLYRVTQCCHENRGSYLRNKVEIHRYNIVSRQSANAVDRVLS